jgi:membrane associated rhomboid family serine protease
MAIGTRDYARPYLAGGRLPFGVKALLISNSVIFLLQFFAQGTRLDLLFQHLALIPADVVQRFYIWQLVTYLFLHGGIWHILINMLTLWMFGKDLEQTWGTRRFLRFYFFCGIGAGVCVVLANYLFGNKNVGTIGASGAIYGILLVSAILWPDRIIIFYIFPIKMKYFVMIFAGIAFLGVLDLNSGVSNVAHLSGMAFGYIFLKSPKMRGVDPLGWLDDSYKAWKLARAKRKFQVYLRKQRPPDKDRWVN